MLQTHSSHQATVGTVPHVQHCWDPLLNSHMNKLQDPVDPEADVITAEGI